MALYSNIQLIRYVYEKERHKYPHNHMYYKCIIYDTRFPIDVMVSIRQKNKMIIVKSKPFFIIIPSRDKKEFRG